MHRQDRSCALWSAVSSPSPRLRTTPIFKGDYSRELRPVEWGLGTQFALQKSWTVLVRFSLGRSLIPGAGWSSAPTYRDDSAPSPVAQPRSLKRWAAQTAQRSVDYSFDRLPGLGDPASMRSEARIRTGQSWPSARRVQKYKREG